MNALAIYRILKQNGVPDSQIILMIADEYAINSRNPFKNGMYANGVTKANWYSQHTEIDYRGADVNVKNFLDATLGTAPLSIQSNSNSSLLIYVSGHGGDQFFKFQDEEEVTSTDIANLMDALSSRNRFKQALFIADTCQAFTLFDKMETKNVLALGTSLKNENAYAHHSDQILGLSVIERWTHGFNTQYAKNSNPKATLGQLMVDPFEGFAPLGAHVGTKENSIRFRDVLVSDFFGDRKYQQQKKRNGSSGSPGVINLGRSEEYQVGDSSMKSVFAEGINAGQFLMAYDDQDSKKTDSVQATVVEPEDIEFRATVFGMIGFLVFLVFLERKFKKS